MRDDLCMSDNARNDVERMDRRDKMDKMMGKAATRISMPALHLSPTRSNENGAAESDEKNSPSIGEGIAIIDSILNQDSSLEGALKPNELQRLLQLKKSLEKLEKDDRACQKTKRRSKPLRPPGFVSISYLRDDFGISLTDSDDDISNIDDDYPNFEREKSRARPSAAPTYKYSRNTETGMNVLYAFGAVPAEHKARKKLFIRSSSGNVKVNSSRERRSFVERHSRNVRIKKLASRRASSLTQSIQSDAPNEWYKLPRGVQVQLATLLSWENLSKWDFDVFEIDRLTNGQPLLFVGWAILSSPYSQHVMAEVLLQRNQKRPIPFEMMQGYRFIDEFNIDQKKMTNFLRAIERDYIKENPYHNNIHAADVTQTLHSLLQGMGAANRLDPPPIQLFAVLLAAVIHDVGHPGYNNFFQQKTNSDIAICYNDQSILENMHLAMAFRKLIGAKRSAKLDIFGKMQPEEIVTIRKFMVHAVLGTDMSKHFEKVNDIKKEIASMVEGEPVTNETSWEILHYMMHVADISNGAKHRRIAVQWTDRCLEEFFKQGDTEKDMGLPVTPLCDRDTVSRPESQSGFVEFIIKPTFEVLVGIMPKIGEKIIPILDDNLAYWNSQLPKKAIDEMDLLRVSFHPNEGILGDSSDKTVQEVIDELKALDYDDKDSDDEKIEPSDSYGSFGSVDRSFADLSVESAIIFETSSDETSEALSQLSVDISEVVKQGLKVPSQNQDPSLQRSMSDPLSLHLGSSSNDVAKGIADGESVVSVDSDDDSQSVYDC